MNNNKKIHLMQGTLRAGVCMFMLSGACVLSAQTPQDGDNVAAHSAPTAPAAKKKAPKYQMKEVTGYVFDGATRKPVVGASVQSLSNSYYSAMSRPTCTDSRAHIAGCSVHSFWRRDASR